MSRKVACSWRTRLNSLQERSEEVLEMVFIIFNILQTCTVFSKAKALIAQTTEGGNQSSNERLACEDLSKPADESCGLLARQLPTI